MRHPDDFVTGLALRSYKSIRTIVVCGDSKAVLLCSGFLTLLVFFAISSVSLQLEIEMFASAQQQPTQRIPPPTSLLQQNNLSQSLVQVTAGKIQDISFKIDIANDTLGTSGFPQSITNAVVSIASQSGSVKIIGPTTWNLPSIDPNTKHVISTKVYAAPAIIGSPVFFTVTVQYIKNNQELKTNSFDIGAIVTGEIKIDANNLAIRYIGNTPSLVGSLLNKGNTGALFTNIEVLPGSNPTVGQSHLGNVQPTSESFQYLGTLPPNTPTPFSIPIMLNSKLLDLIQINSNSSNSILPKLKLTNDSMGGVGAWVNSTYSDVNKNKNGSDFNNATTAANMDLSKSNVLGSQTNYLIPIKITYTDELTNEHSVILNRSVPLVRSDLQSSNLESLTGTNNDSSQPAYVVNNGFIDAYWAENVLASDTNTSSSSDSSESTSANSELEVIQNQREVSPGEGPAILAVVLSNIAFSDITGVTGYLTLPNGFSSMIALPPNSSASSSSSAYAVTNGSNGATLPAISSIKDIVKAGQAYTLYFKVNVLDSATVGPHTALLRTYYFKTSDPEIGAYRVQTTNVPFVLPGKVVMDITSSSTDLTPGEVNNIKIQLRNRGTADANNVLVTLNSASGSIITNQPSVSDDGSSLGGQGQGINGPESNLTEIPRQSNSSNTVSKLIDSSEGRDEAPSLGSRVFNLGTIAANSASEINAAILPSFSAGESLQNLNLELTYTDATGKTRTSEEEIGFRVLPNIPEGGLEINPNRIPPQQQLPPEVMSDSNNTTGAMNGTFTNRNNESSDKPPPSGLRLRVNPTSLLMQKSNNGTSNNGNNTGFHVNGSANGVSLPIKSAVLMIKRNDSSPSLYNHQISLIGNNNNNNATNGITKNNTSITTAAATGGDEDTYGLEDLPAKSTSIGRHIEDNSLTITAGEESDVNFTITNNNKFPILDAVVSLESQSGSISISGPSNWNLQRLDPGAHQSFDTTVFASTDLIGNPASFEVGVQYIMNGRARDDNFTMGAKVIGDIDVDVSNLAINNIAGTPNLVGNLLNKGNTIALFTTIQLLAPSNNTDDGGLHQTRQEGKTPYQANSSSSQSFDQSSDQKKSSNNTTRVLIPSSTLPSYLGDLDSNSPLPFSIPLNFQNNSSPGKYPVSLKITYSDDLRANHELVINDTVDFSQRGGRNRDNSNNDEGIMGIMLGDSYSLKFGGFSVPLLIIIIIIAILLIALKIYRRRSRSKSVSTYVTAKSKDEKFFLDEKRNKDEMPTSSHINLSEGREDNNISTREEKSREKTDIQREGSDLAK